MKNLNIIRLLVLTIILSFTNQSNSQTSEHFDCSYEDRQSNSPDLNGTNYSPNGNAFTPKGTFRFLFVVAGFEGFEGKKIPGTNSIEGPNLDNWNNDISDDYQLPNYISYDPNSGDIDINSVFFQEEGDFSNSDLMANPDYQINLSNTINLMSKPNEDFKYVGGMFTDDTGQPVQVVIDPTSFIPDPFKQWNSIGDKVFEKMMEINPDFDWENYDQRTNDPDYEEDNSATPTPDGIIDFLVILYRYNQGWSIQPMDGMPYGGGNGGISYMSSTAQEINGYTTNWANGITQGYVTNPRMLMFHEYSHAVYSCPHFAGGGAAGGPFFYKATGGIGGTAFPHFFQPMHNSWERWFQGYITPIEPTTNDEIILEDFVLTGDAIRIAIPHSGGQYLWIENHTRNHPLDEGYWNGNEIGPNGYILPGTPAGIYMFVEDVSGSLTNTSIGYGGNKLKFINASGNWDFEFDPTVDPIFNNDDYLLGLYNRTLPNPIGGNSPWVTNFYDYDGENGIGFAEFRDVLRESYNGNETISYRAFGVSAPGFKEPSFLEGDIINMETNPTLINVPWYEYAGNTVNRFKPFYLNGLSVEVTSIDQDGIATLDIKFDHTSVNNNVRWTGDIKLPNITEDDLPDLTIGSSKQITLDKNNTINTWALDPITNEYIRPSEFTIESGAKLMMEENSNFTIQRHSKLIIDEGSEVIMKNGACIVIEDTGILELKGNNITMMGERALILIKKGGTLKTADGVDFTFDIKHDVVDGEIVNLAGGYIAFEAGNIVELGEGSDFILTRTSFPQTKSILMLEASSLNLLGNHKLALRNIMIEYNNNSKIDIEDGIVDFSFVRMIYDGNGDYDGITGIKGTNLSECSINYLESTNIGTTAKFDGFTSPGTHNLRSLIVIDGNNGVNASNLGAHLSIITSTFQGLSETAVKLSNLNYVLLDQNDVEESNTHFSVEGYDLDNVGFADINRGLVRDCITGISALNSNVFLRRGQTIGHNINGVVFEDSGTIDFALTVGDIGCANIIYNEVGVSGENIIMNIDAIEHAANNNDLIPKANRFNGNDILFDICYTHPTLVNDSPTILMKGNYFGGGGYLSIASLFTINPLSGGSSCTDIISFDDTDFVTLEPTLDCEFLNNPTPQPFPDKVKCIVEKADIDIMVHEQSRSAHLKLVEQELLSAQSEYQPIANLTIEEVDYDPSCLNKIYFARCMALADIDDAFNPLVALLLDEWGENVVIENTKNTIDYFMIFPNPSTNLITIQNKYESEFEIKIINTYGNEVYYAEFIQQLHLDTNIFEKGIYFVSLLDKSLKKSVQKKIVIQ